MTWLRLVRAEIRKLTTTKLPPGFLAVLVLIAGIDAAVVVFGTDMDGSKAFIATAADQQSLMAFAFNAMLGTGLIGQGLIIAGVAAALPSTEYAFPVSAGDVTRLLAATTIAGAVGAVLGAGLGAVIRNLGGAVTAVVLALFMLPPLVVQLFSDAASWIPPALGAVISGVSTDLDTWAALTALLAYGALPAAAGLILVQRRDVV